MEKLFELPELLTLSGEIFDSQNAVAFPSACEAGCEPGCVPGTGSGELPVESL